MKFNPMKKRLARRPLKKPPPRREPPPPPETPVDRAGPDLYDDGHFFMGRATPPVPSEAAAPAEQEPPEELCGKPIGKISDQVTCGRTKGHEAQGFACEESFSDRFQKAYRAALNADADEYADAPPGVDEPTRGGTR